MEMEQSPDQEPKPMKYKNFILKEKNNMEMDLMERSPLNKLGWVEKYGKKFAEIIEDPAQLQILLGLYHQDPKLAEDYIEKRLELSDAQNESSS